MGKTFRRKKVYFDDDYTYESTSKNRKKGKERDVRETNRRTKLESKFQYLEDKND